MKRDLELATTGTVHLLSGTQPSNEAPLIMQIRHRLLAAQAPGNKDNICSFPYHTRISFAQAAHRPLTSQVCYSVSELWRTGNEHQHDSDSLIQSAGC